MLYFISKFLSCSCLPFQILCLFLQILLTEKKKLQYFVCLFCYRFPDWTILTAISSVNFNFHQFWHSDCTVLGKVDYFMHFDLEVVSCYIFIHPYPRFSKFFLVLFIVLNISVKTRLEKNRPSSKHINEPYIRMISVYGKNWEQNTRIISGIHLIAVKHTFVYESSVYVHMCICVCV